MRVNSVSNASQPRFNAVQTPSKSMGQKDPNQVARTRHVRGSATGFETSALGLGDPPRKNADPLNVLNTKQRHLTLSI